MSDDRAGRPDPTSGPVRPRPPGPADAGQPPVDAAPVDAHPVDAHPGAAHPGDAHPVDAVAGDPAAGDAVAGDAVAGDAVAGDAVAGDAVAESRMARRRRPRSQKKHRKAPWWELPALVALAIGIAIVVKTFVVQPFYIPSDSMEKTLHGCTGCRGDRILVNKPAYDIGDPNPGDIVVFHAPTGWDSEPASTPPSNPITRVIRGFGQLVGLVPPDGQVLVKRVIGVGGQTVKGDAEGHVMISTHGPTGPFRTLKEPYVHAPATEAANQVAFGPVTVPKGRLWVMGDHRTDSADSRFHCTPGGPEGTVNDGNCDPTASTVPVNDVIGKAFVIAWPPSRWTTLGTPSTFAAASGSALPAAVPVATIVPLLLVRRRRRRR